MPAEALAVLICLSLAIIALAIVSWYQGDMIKKLQKRVSAIEDDRAERKASVLYTRPLRIQPDNSGSDAVSRRERRRRGEVGE